MAQQPAVVIVARHGPRLDAADQQWHLSTPTPYDPPLTYGGWNQCRALGLRIANLLHAREEKLNTPGESDGVSAHDFAAPNGKRGPNEGDESGRARKRRRVVKHKVVIHSSPFLRCLQTSTAIAAGLAQYSPSIETGAGSSSATTSEGRSPTPAGVSSAPRLRAGEGGGASPHLSPIPEPKHDLAHEVARRALHERKRHRRSKLRVDAFLGEWMNPQYFENITPPPPSSMMVKTAKAELMQNEAVEVYTPLVTSSGRSSGNSSLWNGHAKRNSLEEWSHIQESLPVREGRSRASTVGSDSSQIESGRKSPFRHGLGHHSPFTSMLPKPELSIYNPPMPQYAVSGSDQIPRGYFAHAKNACTNVDFQWDSSRPPQNWGEGGEYGEEWSSMHKRFRKGVTNLVRWYGQHDADDRGEDALGFEQADRNGHAGGANEEPEEEEELVVVMVTHGAGCNALIGALTNQPVLLDVGMASLTMAVRKDDAPTESAVEPTEEQLPVLSSIYDMKLVASTDHLRPSSTISQASHRGSDLASVRESLAQFKQQQQQQQQQQRTDFGSRSSAFSSLTSEPPRFEAPRSNTSSLLGSIRRPSAAPLSAPGSTLPSRMNSFLPNESSAPVTQGLWTPPAGRTPLLRPDDRKNGSRFERLGQDGAEEDTMVLDFSNSPPDSRPVSRHGAKAPPAVSSINGTLNGDDRNPASKSDGAAASAETRELLSLGGKVPNGLSRGLGEEGGLWGNQPGGDAVEHKSPELPKRRWTVDDRE